MRRVNHCTRLLHNPPPMRMIETKVIWMGRTRLGPNRRSMKDPGGPPTA